MRRQQELPHAVIVAEARRFSAVLMSTTLGMTACTAAKRAEQDGHHDRIAACQDFRTGGFEMQLSESSDGGLS